MNRRESKFQTKFGRWVKYRWPEERNAHFELKVAKEGEPLPFSAVSDKQKANLYIAKRRFFHKYSDIDRLGTPFDCSHVGKAETFVVIQYEKPKQKEFFLCPIDIFLEEEEREKKKEKGRKSLTEERARQICIPEKLG